jgi:hypothetical protein
MEGENGGKRGSTVLDNVTAGTSHGLVDSPHACGSPILPLVCVCVSGCRFITFEEDSSAEAVFEAGQMHELGGYAMLSCRNSSGAAPAELSWHSWCQPTSCRAVCSSMYVRVHAQPMHSPCIDVDPPPQGPPRAHTRMRWTLHSAGGKEVEVKPATPKGTGAAVTAGAGRSGGGRGARGGGRDGGGGRGSPLTYTPQLPAAAYASPYGMFNYPPGGVG